MNFKTIRFFPFSEKYAKIFSKENLTGREQIHYDYGT